MRHLRIATALFLTLLWMPSVTHCLLAAEFPEAFGVCCDCEEGGTGSGSLPMDEGSCNQCVTLETGVNPGSLVPSGVPSAVFWDEDSEMRRLRLSLELAATMAASSIPPMPVWSPPPPRVVALTRAHPVRGPSLA